MGSDQVVDEPLEAGRELLENLCLKACRYCTISSGSSGKSVTVPEPSRSIFCFIRRIVEKLLTNLYEVL